jgi:hypothetical protein
MKKSSYNYFDQTPGGLKDFLLMNSLDQEEFSLFGIKTVYFPLNLYQENFDEVFRDLVSSKNFLDPIECRSYFKVEESTNHGMTETGAVQNAERTGNVWFNISLLESILNRVPVIGDVLEDLQVHQKFEVFKISKEKYRLGRALQYNLSVRLYQDTAGPSTYQKSN